MQPWRLSAIRAPVVLAPVAALAVLALLPGVVAPGASGAQNESDNELDRFMERVLAQRERNAAARLQYVLDEESRIRLTGPDGDVFWGFRGECTWYERDGFFVRSPTRIDGVTIDEASRRDYEAEWLEREQRRHERRQEERRSPTPSSSSSSSRGTTTWSAARPWPDTMSSASSTTRSSSSPSLTMTVPPETRNRQATAKRRPWTRPVW